MTYNALESSPYSGNPVELYEFINGAASWRYTSADHDEISAGASYTAIMIRRSSQTETQEIGKNNITVTVPIDSDIARMHLSYPPTSVTSLTVFRLHDSDGTRVTSWIGRVLNASLSDGGATVALHCEPITTSIRRPGLHRHFSRECPYALYQAGCNLSQEAFKVTESVVSMVGLTVTVSGSYVDNRFAGGMLSWTVANGTQWRFITGSTGNTININFPVLASDPSFGAVLPAGTVVYLFPGCAHTLTDCGNKFNNVINNGAFGFIPLVNPFNNTTLF